MFTRLSIYLNNIRISCFFLSTLDSIMISSLADLFSPVPSLVSHLASPLPLGQLHPSSL